MKCINHSETDAVAACARCSVGICQDCTNGTFYQIDNKPLCKKCNYEVGLENDSIFKKFLRGKYIKLGIFSVTFVFGLIMFIVTRIDGQSTFSSVFTMLLIWGIGFIGNFFDKQPDTRSVKTQMKDAITEVNHPISTLIGKILGLGVSVVIT